MTSEAIPSMSPLGDRPEAATPMQDDMLLPSASTLIYVNPDPAHRRSWLSRLRHRRDADIDDVAQMNARHLTDGERRRTG